MLSYFCISLKFLKEKKDFYPIFLANSALEFSIP